MCAFYHINRCYVWVSRRVMHQNWWNVCVWVGMYRKNRFCVWMVQKAPSWHIYWLINNANHIMCFSCIFHTYFQLTLPTLFITKQHLFAVKLDLSSNSRHRYSSLSPSPSHRSCIKYHIKKSVEQFHMSWLYSLNIPHCTFFRNIKSSTIPAYLHHFGS